MPPACVQNPWPSTLARHAEHAALCAVPVVRCSLCVVPCYLIMYVCVYMLRYVQAIVSIWRCLGRRVDEWRPSMIPVLALFLLFKLVHTVWCTKKSPCCQEYILSHIPSLIPPLPSICFLGGFLFVLLSTTPAYFFTAASTLVSAALTCDWAAASTPVTLGLVASLPPQWW